MQPRFPRQAPRRMGMNMPYRFPSNGVNGMRAPRQMGGGSRQGGGLLRSLLQRKDGAGGGIQQAIQGFSRASEGGSFLQTMTNPQNLQSILNQTQQVLKTAQQVGPMVQQYGPLVKNLPAMWKLYRSLNSAETAESSSQNTATTEDAQKQEIIFNESKEESTEKRTSARGNGESVPKLFFR